MFFSQASAAGYMFAFPALSKATFTSGPAERASALYESMRAAAGYSATLKLSARLVCAGRRGVVLALLFICFFFFFFLLSLLRGALAFLTNQDVVRRFDKFES